MLHSFSSRIIIHTVSFLFEQCQNNNKNKTLNCGKGDRGRGTDVLIYLSFIAEIKILLKVEKCSL